MTRYEELFLAFKEGNISQYEMEVEMADLLDKEEFCPSGILAFLVTNYSLEQWHILGKIEVNDGLASRSITDVLYINGRYFELKWKKMESFEKLDEFPNQPHRTYPHIVIRK